MEAPGKDSVQPVQLTVGCEAYSMFPLYVTFDLCGLSYGDTDVFE